MERNKKGGGETLLERPVKVRDASRLPIVTGWSDPITAASGSDADIGPWVFSVGRGTAKKVEEATVGSHVTRGSLKWRRCASQREEENRDTFFSRGMTGGRAGMAEGAILERSKGVVCVSRRSYRAAFTWELIRRSSVAVNRS